MTEPTHPNAQNTEHGTAPLLRSAAPPPAFHDAGTPSSRLVSAERPSGAVDGTPDTPASRGTFHGLRARIAEHLNARAAKRSAKRSAAREHGAAEQHGTPSGPPALTAAERSAARRTVERSTARPPSRPAAASRRSTGRPTEQTPEQIAPVPQGLLWLGVWLDRTFGSLPLITPLAVSGYLTCQVFLSAPLHWPTYAAVPVAFALEGGLWKLVRIRERTQLEGDSTLGLTALIAAYLLLIATMIFGHNYYVALLEARKAITGPVGTDAVLAELGWNWAPAAGSALLCVLGVAINSKDARFRHRRRLREQNRVDRQAPRFSVWSWFVCPWETPWAFRHAVRYRIDSPLDAVDDYRAWHQAGKPKRWKFVPPVHDGDEQNDDLQNEENVLRRTAADVTGRGTFRVPRQTDQIAPVSPAVPSVPWDAAERGTPTGVPGAVGRVTEHAGRSVDDRGTFPVSRNAGNTDGTQGADDVDPDLIAYSDHILAVAAWEIDWARQVHVTGRNGRITVRAANAAIAADRSARGAGSYNSFSVTSKVLETMRRISRDPDLAARVTAEAAQRAEQRRQARLES